MPTCSSCSMPAASSEQHAHLLNRAPRACGRRAHEKKKKNVAGGGGWVSARQSARTSPTYSTSQSACDGNHKGHAPCSRRANAATSGAPGARRPRLGAPCGRERLAPANELVRGQAWVTFTNVEPSQRTRRAVKPSDLRFRGQRRRPRRVHLTSCSVRTRRLQWVACFLCCTLLAA